MIASRRHFLKTTATGGMVLALSTLWPLRGLVFADTSVYRGASILPPSYASIANGIKGFVEQLDKNAHDVLKVEFYDSGTLLGPDEQLAGLREGIIRFMFLANTYISREFPILGVIGLNEVFEQLYEHGERLAMESPLWKLINNELAKGNLFMLSIGAGILGPLYIWSGKEKVASLADLQGKRCRVVSPEAISLLENFGAKPVRILSDQVYLALQRGSVDAVVATAATVVGRNLHEHLRYCFRLGLTAASIGVFLQKDVWDKMPVREKSAFWEAGRWYDEYQGRLGYKKIVLDECWPIIMKAGIKIVEPSAAELDIFKKKSKPITEEWMGRVGEETGRKAIGIATGII